MKKRILTLIIALTLLTSCTVAHAFYGEGDGEGGTYIDALSNDIYTVVGQIDRTLGAEYADFYVHSQFLSTDEAFPIPYNAYCVYVYLKSNHAEEGYPTDTEDMIKDINNLVKQILYYDNTTAVVPLTSEEHEYLLSLYNDDYTDYSENLPEGYTVEYDYSTFTRKIVDADGNAVLDDGYSDIDFFEDHFICKKTNLEGFPLTFAEYYDYNMNRIENFSQFMDYNDGLSYDHDYNLVDVNNNIVYFNGMLTQFTFDYNIGWIYEISNNGGMMYQQDFEEQRDYDGDGVITDIDYEWNRQFQTSLTNTITFEKYSFDADISDIDNNGYFIVRTKPAEGGVFTSYLARMNRGIIPTVQLNDKKIKFDQVPVIENGRTLVPLRAIFEKLGATIDWNGDTQTVTATKDDTTITLIIGNTEATKNGESITLDVPAQIVNGRTLVPVRFVADSFGVDVAWDQVMQKVSLTSK